MEATKKLLLPENYAVLTDDEMTYTQGGAQNGGYYDPDQEAAAALGYLIGFSISFGNYVWALTKTRDWIKKNKSDRTVGQMISKGLDDTFAYMNSSIGNAIVGIYTIPNFIGWSTMLLPVTVIAWVTA